MTTQKQLCTAAFLTARLQSPHPLADTPNSHPIPRIRTLILNVPLIPFLNSTFWSLQIAYSVRIF